MNLKGIRHLVVILTFLILLTMEQVCAGARHMFPQDGDPFQSVILVLNGELVGISSDG